MPETRTPLQVKKDLREQGTELKPMIHRGAQKEVAEKIGKDPSYVTAVLNGRRWDLEVIEEIIKLAKAEGANLEKLPKEINMKPSLTFRDKKFAALLRGQVETGTAPSSRHAITQRIIREMTEQEKTITKQ